MINRFIKCEPVAEAEGIIRKVGQPPIGRFKAIEVGELCETVQKDSEFVAYKGAVVDGIVNEREILFAFDLPHNLKGGTVVVF